MEAEKKIITNGAEGVEGQNPQHIHTQSPETQPSRRKQTDVRNGEEGE
jgi:hypothetical protein